jgi:hypothetical protein
MHWWWMVVVAGERERKHKQRKTSRVDKIRKEKEKEFLSYHRADDEKKRIQETAITAEKRN